MRSSGDARLFFQMLIQAAVCCHHYDKANLTGARGLFSRVVDKLSRLPAVYMSLDLTRFSQQFKTFFAEMLKEGDVFKMTETLERPIIHLLSDDADEADLSAAAEI